MRKATTSHFSLHRTAGKDGGEYNTRCRYGCGKAVKSQIPICSKDCNSLARPQIAHRYHAALADPLIKAKKVMRVVHETTRHSRVKCIHVAPGLS